jgi:hypothetical protein
MVFYADLRSEEVKMALWVDYFLHDPQYQYLVFYADLRPLSGLLPLLSTVHGILCWPEVEVKMVLLWVGSLHDPQCMVFYADLRSRSRWSSSEWVPSMIHRAWYFKLNWGQGQEGPPLSGLFPPWSTVHGILCWPEVEVKMVLFWVCDPSLIRS